MTLFLVSVLTAGPCWGEPAVSRQAVPPGPELAKDEDRLAEEYRDAYRQAKRGEPAGYLKLYEIAAAGRSAEISENARDRLHHFLYLQPELWVRAMVRVDFATLERYLARGGMAVVQLPKGVKTHKEYENTIITKLKQIRGDEHEMRLVKFILTYYAEHPYRDDD